MLSHQRPELQATELSAIIAETLSAGEMRRVHFVLVLYSLNTLSLAVVFAANRTQLLSGAAILQRGKRYLLFEKGASVVFTANMGKAIISGRPRGLSQMHELSLYYDLPSTLDMVLPKRGGQHRRTTTTTTTTTGKPILLPWLQSGPFQTDYYTSQAGEKWRPVQQPEDFKSKERVTPENVCSARDVFGQPWNVQRSRCGFSARRQREARRATSTPEHFMFFDLIEQWALLHNFNGRYCVLRTLCEARHLLFRPGLSLFHDMLRILIDFSLPHLQQDATLQRSLRHTALAECERFYGPHCRLSFLQHFTHAVHGKSARRKGEGAGGGRGTQRQSKAPKTTINYSMR